MRDKRECDACIYKRAESEDDNGKRIVDCAINDLQMYQPYSYDCKKWKAKPEWR